jgi:hypothetical protein
MGGAFGAYGEERGVQGVLVGKPEEKRGHWGDTDVVGMIILRWIFRKLDGNLCALKDNSTCIRNMGQKVSECSSVQSCRLLFT